MTTQDRINDAVENIRDLGYQWQRANAHGKAAAVIVGMMRTGEVLSLPLDEAQLIHLEAVGADAIIGHVTMPVYAALVEHFMPDPNDEEDEDDAE